MKYWSWPFYHFKLVFFLPHDLAYSILNVCHSHYNVGPSTCEEKSPYYLMKAPKIAKFLDKSIPHTYWSRYFFSVNSYFCHLELGFSVDECHYCLNSRTYLNRKNYIKPLHHCIVLASLWLFWVHTNISTHFKVHVSQRFIIHLWFWKWPTSSFQSYFKNAKFEYTTEIVQLFVNFKISKPVEN